MPEAFANRPRVEYAVEVVKDTFQGGVDTDRLEAVLKARAAEGWRLAAAFDSETQRNGETVAGFTALTVVGECALVFERELPADDALASAPKDEAGESARADVTQHNVSGPFEPLRVTLARKGRHTTAALTVSCSREAGLKAVHAEVALVNLFGDRATVPDAYFYSFRRTGTRQYTSAPFPVDVPEGMRLGLSAAEVRVKRYVTSDGAHTPGEAPAAPAAGAPAAAKFDREAFLRSASTATRAAEVLQRVREAAPEHPELQGSLLTNQLLQLAARERTFNIDLSSEAVDRLREYFDALP